VYFLGHLSLFGLLLSTISVDERYNNLYFIIFYILKIIFGLFIITLYFCCVASFWEEKMKYSPIVTSFV